MFQSSFFEYRALTLPDGWKTQDGRMRKKCDARERLYYNVKLNSAFRFLVAMNEIYSISSLFLLKPKVSGFSKQKLVV